MSWQQQTFLFATEPGSPPSLPPNSGLTPAVTPAVVAVAESPLPASAADLPAAGLPAADSLAPIDRLRQAVRRLERRTESLDDAEPVLFSAGGPVLDGLLPHGGLRPGTLVEWVCDARRAGATLLAMVAAASVLRHEASRQRPLLVIDGLSDRDQAGNESFYPPAAISLGIPADALMIVRKQRGHTRGDLVWAIDQALRSGAVAAVYAEIGDWLAPTDARRLQLAAEAGGAIGLLVRPIGSRPSELRPAGARSPVKRSPTANPAGRASFADVRWIVSSLPGHGDRRLRVELDRCRGGVTGASRVIEIGVSPDRWTGYGATHTGSDSGTLVVIREVKHAEIAARNVAVGKIGARVGGTSHATIEVASDLAGRLADPAAQARSPGRRQPAGRSADRRHAG